VKPLGKIFLLDDDELIVSMLERALTGDGYDVRAESDPEGVVDRIRIFSPDVVLLDIHLPGHDGIEILGEIVSQGIPSQVVMLTSDDTAEMAVKAMKVGAADYLTKPFNLDEVKIVVAGILERAKLKNEVAYLRKISSDLTRHEIIGKTNAIHKLKEKCGKFAAAAVPVVLITGESGTGKEVFAREIHRRMHPPESGGFAPFLGINCAALPEQLIESELFGHEKGAFTDAKAEKKGIFEAAHGGSILLDEIGEMRLDLQAKLLRVLEERNVRRIGGRRDIPVDATVFATTNRDLEGAVERGEFRVDLFYRLNAFSLHLPPLRERRGDIPLLARHFLRVYAEKYKKPGLLTEISPGAEELLVAYRWPGNIRELRNLIERIVVLENGERVLPEHLPAEVVHRREGTEGGGRPGPTLPDAGISMDAMEKSMIVQALEKAGGNKAKAARLLGITYDSLRYQVKKFGLE